MARLYLNKTINTRKLYPPTSGDMQPENMPGYHAPCVLSEFTTEATTISTNLKLGESVDQIIAPLLTSVMINVSGGHKFCLQTVPILTGFLSETKQPNITRCAPIKSLYCSVGVQCCSLFICRICIS